MLRAVNAVYGVWDEDEDYEEGEEERE